MRIGIGIDTGGTYTDAVLYDMDAGCVMHSAKALTTRRDLSIGIGEALDALPGELRGQARLVALSTTLATNACVEHKGGRAKLMLLGISKKTIDWVGADYGLYDDGNTLCVDAKGTFDGKVIDEPDWDALTREHGDFFTSAEGLGIVETYAKNNGAVREKHAKRFFETRYSIPVVCGHELFSELNSLQRGASTLLNVRLIPIMREFLLAIETAIKQRGIDAPVVIVRSDASLMSEAFSRERPVETILCGPAASLLGGWRLSRHEDCVVVDMGGTTTDISIVRRGVPVRVTDGVRIGGWRTFVKGVFIETIALGGDSAIRMREGKLTICERRVTPLCVAASEYPSIKPELQRLVDSGKLHSRPLHEFFILARDIRDSAKYTSRELRFCEALKAHPLSMSAAAAAVGETVTSLDVSRLENEGLVMRIGFTPTDVMHLTGDFCAFDSEASKLAARYFLMCLPEHSDSAQGLTSFCDEVYELVKRTLYSHVVRALMRNRFSELPVDDAALSKLIDVAWDSRGESAAALLRLNLSTGAALVGVGAPIHIFLPDVARALGAECVIPEHAAVANAVGAIVGRISAVASVDIVPECFAGGVDGYTVRTPNGHVQAEDMQKALAIARESASEAASNEAVLRGASHGVSVVLDISENCAYAREGQRIELGTIVTATATGEF